MRSNNNPDIYYEYTNKEKILGLNFNSAGFTKHHRNRINTAKNALTKVQQFHNQRVPSHTDEGGWADDVTCAAKPISRGPVSITST